MKNSAAISKSDDAIPEFAFVFRSAAFSLIAQSRSIASHVFTSRDMYFLTLIWDLPGYYPVVFGIRQRSVTVTVVTGCLVQVTLVPNCLQVYRSSSCASLPTEYAFVSQLTLRCWAHQKFSLWSQFPKFVTIKGQFFWNDGYWFACNFKCIENFISFSGLFSNDSFYNMNVQSTVADLFLLC